MLGKNFMTFYGHKMNSNLIMFCLRKVAPMIIECQEQFIKEVLLKIDFLGHFMIVNVKMAKQIKTIKDNGMMVAKVNFISA